MATNRKYGSSRRLRVTATAGGVAAGDPVVVGAGITGVAVAAKDGSNVCVIEREGVYTLAAVHGVDGSGNSAVAVGDVLYFLAGDGWVSKKATGVKFGYALSTLTSGATGAVDVALCGGA